MLWNILLTRLRHLKGKNNMTRDDAKLWMVEMRWQLLQKYRQLSELKEHFEIDDKEIFNVLTSYAVLLYLDDLPQPIFGVYEAFDAADLEAIVYGTDAEATSIAETNQQDTADADLSGNMEAGETLEVGYPADYYRGSIGEFPVDSD
jgi:hypothetical protein